jgi:hypothetical protein
MGLTEGVTVLSFSSDHGKANGRAKILKQNGFEVRCVSSPVQAQFEIEMGQCGVFVTCPLVSQLVTADLVGVFRRYCPDGIVVFVKSERARTIDADITLDESDDPAKLAEAILSHLRDRDRLVG